MRQVWLGAALVLTMLAGTGCASVFQGPKQKVEIVTEPPASNVEVDHVRLGRSPAIVQLRRGKPHTLKVSKPGYEDKFVQLTSSVNGGWVVLDVVCWVIPAVVDWANANWESFDNPTFVALQAKAAPDSGAAIAAIDSAAAEPTSAQSGEVMMKNHELTACLCDSCFIKCAVSVGWHKREVTLQLYGPIHAGLDAMGPFSKNKLSSSTDLTFYIQSNDGVRYRLEVEAVSNEAARLKWARL